jgi:hypothetical protein
MNFKNLILLAGAIAFASACKGDECPEQLLAESNEGDSNKMAESVEEESNELAQKACAVNPKLCARCKGAAGRRNARRKQIYAWRDAQRRIYSAKWAVAVKKRAHYLKYWGTTWWGARVR